uniref:Uncharacterized protein n=1 Tax=Arundo donax TaxID=35708 RepID=A0A0A9FHL7_ARUDO
MPETETAKIASEQFKYTFWESTKFTLPIVADRNNFEVQLNSIGCTIFKLCSTSATCST